MASCDYREKLCEIRVIFLSVAGTYFCVLLGLWCFCIWLLFIANYNFYHARTEVPHEE